MPKSAACNINGQEGNIAPACLSVSVYARMLIGSFAAYQAGGISAAVTLLASEDEQAWSQNTTTTAAAALAL